MLRYPIDVLAEPHAPCDISKLPHSRRKSLLEAPYISTTSTLPHPAGGKIYCVDNLLLARLSFCRHQERRRATRVENTAAGVTSSLGFSDTLPGIGCGHQQSGPCTFMGKLCVERCGRDSSHGDGTIGKRTHCATCAPQSMVNLKNPRCRLCTKRASKGMADSKVALFCSDHAAEGMVDVRSRLCVEAGCKKQPSKAAPGSNVARFCAGHAPAGAVRIRGGKGKLPLAQPERKRRAAEWENGVEGKKLQPGTGGTTRAARAPSSAFTTSAQDQGGAVNFDGVAGGTYDTTFRGLQEVMKEFVTCNGHDGAGGGGRAGAERLGGLQASSGGGCSKAVEQGPSGSGPSSAARFTAAAALLSLLPSMSGSSAKRRPHN